MRGERLVGELSDRISLIRSVFNENQLTVSRDAGHEIVNRTVHIKKSRTNIIKALRSGKYADLKVAHPYIGYVRGWEVLSYQKPESPGSKP